MIKLIKAIGDVEELNEAETTFETLQELVGGYVEPLYITESVATNPETFVMICDEEGRLKGKPVNERASRIADELIVGDVVYMDLETWIQIVG